MDAPRRQEAERLAQADAEALIGDHGAEAYWKARLLQRTARSRAEAHRWRRVALIVAKRTGHRVGRRLG